MLLTILALAPTCLPAQTPAQSNEDTNAVPPKHILFIIPNFRTSPTLKDYKPLTPKQKFNIAKMDTFDRGTVALALAFAGESQLANSDKSFGQGVEGYAHRFGTSYADFAIGNFMTEAIYPTILHQDPRYFRRGTGTKISRLGYAMGQIFWTHHDNGHGEPNYSEILGNATSVAISETYYPDNRRASDAIQSLGTQLGVDMVSNILKEFAIGKK